MPYQHDPRLGYRQPWVMTPFDLVLFIGLGVFIGWVIWGRG